MTAITSDNPMKPILVKYYRDKWHAMPLLVDKSLRINGLSYNKKENYYSADILVYTGDRKWDVVMRDSKIEFDKFNNFFSTTIAISPLLGLLGTVFGLINSFSFIEIGNIGVNAEEVTGGISEALISTAAGLIIAIFTLVFSNYFKAIKNKQLRIMNEFCGKFETIYSTKNF